MIERTPQYTIYENEESRVLMTATGIKTYSRIYYGRPDPVKEPEILPDGKVIYTFNHSRDQMIFYFRRFPANEGIVLSPKSLADEIKAFHEQAWKAYEQGELIESV